jgi:phosphatidylglycerol:prolipoprotein diacylglycerol transferase
MQFMPAIINYPPIDPVIFQIGPLSLRWYGVAYLLGFVCARQFLRRMINRGNLLVSLPALDDLFVWLVLGVLLGGRIGWWFFYHRSGGIEPWYEPVAIWHGGMSFHGGLLGVILAISIWSWRHHTPFWNLADAAALVAPIGLFFGRIANFINAELVGRPTNVPWGIVFPGDVVARHPSQLYEATLEGPLLFLSLWMVKKLCQPRQGQIASLFLILYGMFRFAVEFTREPDPQLGFIAFGWVTMGQLLSAVIAVVGAAIWRLPRRSGAALESDQTSRVAIQSPSPPR